jgi:hypothetical protein
MTTILASDRGKFNFVFRSFDPATGEVTLRRSRHAPNRRTGEFLFEVQRSRERIDVYMQHCRPAT